MVRPLRALYKKAMALAAHPYASYYLGGVSIVEAAFFPLPPDVMLVPMTFVKPHKAWQYAAIATLGSVIGGLGGYSIGHYAFEWIAPHLPAWGYDRACGWFERYGLIAIIFAGFTPIPYKVFTLAAGVSEMALVPFIAGSILGRGMRFFLVTGCIRYWQGMDKTLIIKRLNIIALCITITLGMIFSCLPLIIKDSLGVYWDSYWQDANMLLLHRFVSLNKPQQSAQKPLFQKPLFRLTAPIGIGLREGK